MRSFILSASLTVFSTVAIIAGEAPAGREALEIRKEIDARRANGVVKLVTALAYTPDGKMLTVASFDGTVRLWDANATKVLQTLKSSSLEVYAVAISPDGKFLASAGSWSEVQIWNIATAQELRVLKGHDGPVTTLAFSPDGKLLASGGYDKTIRLWDTNTWTESRKISERLARVTSVGFSPDGKKIASGGTTLTRVQNSNYGVADNVHIWEIATGMVIRELSARGASVSFTPDGSEVLAIGLYIVAKRNSEDPTADLDVMGFTRMTCTDVDTALVRMD